MRITPVEDVLGKLRLLPLRALVPNRDPYLAMLMQPQGIIKVTERHIGHALPEMGEAMCREFLKIAIEKKADLVVTPEYCLPWNVVADIINGHIIPNEGAIWVLGCESITPDNLKELDSVKDNKTIFFYHEPFDEVQKAQKKFISPLLYVFWCRDNTGQKILGLMVQFKTTPCRNRLDVEQRSLYTGSIVYSFNRGLNKIGLFSIICSDAFKLSNELVDEYHTNCLLIHIQLCPKPAHADFAAYRMHLHSVGSNSHVELLCLNWARGVIEIDANGKQIEWNNIAGSAWYVPPSKFNCDDNLVNDSHRGGIYYSLVSQRWHTFFLNYDPQILILQKQKLMIHGEPQVLFPRSCLNIAGRWFWETNNRIWIEQCQADDGFKIILNFYPAISKELTAKAAENPLAVERALELLESPQGNPSTWFHLKELSSMKVDEEESIRCVTVHQEDDPARRGVVFRRARLQRAEDATTLSGRTLVPWPDSVKDLEEGFKFQWINSDPHHNVISAKTGQAASLVYLSDQSDESIVEKAYRKIWQALLNHSSSNAGQLGIDLNEAIIRATDRLCVVYRKDHKYYVWCPKEKNRIDRPPNNTAVGITGE